MRKILAAGYLVALAFTGAAAGDIAEIMSRAKSKSFDASAEIQCAQEVGQALGACRADVARGEGGAAAVVVTFPNGFARTLTFEAGAFLRGNATMSGVGTDMEWHLAGGIYRIRVDDQRFEIPETLVVGG